MSYYSDLSASSSIEDDEEEEECDWKQAEEQEDLWSRCILHLDIDCFYCQCEEIDRNLRQNPRPLAIGQKHIIVTSNYEARKYGVKKLQSREAALASCPSLWIVEGSDLQNYKRYSRKVYEAFRKALKDIAAKLNVSIPVRKGSMDEMMADLSHAVNLLVTQGRVQLSGAPTAVDTATDHTLYQSPFVFGESASPTKLVEDQTGQSTIVSFENDFGPGHASPSRNLPPSRRNVLQAYGTEHGRQSCIRRLETTFQLIAGVCRHIYQETGFYTTGGISVSPLLAKLASDLHKPKSINLLYPWRSCHILYSMPLRKMQSVGHRTINALETSLDFSSSADVGATHQKDVRTVWDLLQVPHESIAKSLQTLQAFQGSGRSSEQCEVLLQKCRGLDTTQIVDDGGGLPKTVSVENSFRRGTVQTKEAVLEALDDLLRRLPLLVNDRTTWARDHDQAFPTTVRLTIRYVDHSLEGIKRRRPFVTKSKQAPMPNGKAFVREKDPAQQTRQLQCLVAPLLDQLLSEAVKTNIINVTRLNIAVSNFQDVVGVSEGQILRSTLTPKRSQIQACCRNISAKKTKLERPGRGKYSAPKKTPASSKKMKATTIDSFFQRKPNR